jgi:hypothetical protein
MIPKSVKRFSEKIMPGKVKVKSPAVRRGFCLAVN